MLRLFLLIHTLFLSLYACQGGYDSCIQKVRDSKTIQKNSLYIPVSKNRLLVYSKRIPNAKILKHDPFLSLYLIADKQKFKYPFDINMRLQLGSALVTQRYAKEGRIIKNQVGLNALAKYSVKVNRPAILTSSCCALEGIATPSGVIQKEYLKRFLSKTPVAYATIGIRVHNEGKYIIVTASNPYLPDNPFKKGDCIIALDGKKYSASSSFMRAVLFSKVGSSHKVTIKRNGKILKLQVKSSKRYGGGAISDTFLEQKGIYFNEKLSIVQLNEKFKKYGLKIGDKLLQVNGVKVKNENELLHYIEDFKEFSSLLFERKGFQFFVNIK